MFNNIFLKFHPSTEIVAITKPITARLSLVSHWRVSWLNCRKCRGRKKFVNENISFPSLLRVEWKVIEHAVNGRCRYNRMQQAQQSLISIRILSGFKRLRVQLLFFSLQVSRSSGEIIRPCMDKRSWHDQLILNDQFKPSLQHCLRIIMEIYVDSGMDAWE